MGERQTIGSAFLLLSSREQKHCFPNENGAAGIWMLFGLNGRTQNLIPKGLSHSAQSNRCSSLFH
jgi:hypothetical protein